MRHHWEPKGQPVKWQTLTSHKRRTKGQTIDLKKFTEKNNQIRLQINHNQKRNFRYFPPLPRKKWRKSFKEENNKKTQNVDKVEAPNIEAT
jgi:hypothetical protein